MSSKQNVLVVGAGGREHALVWKLLQSSRVGKVFVAPGNGGTAAIASNVPIGASETVKLADFARDQGIDLTVVGPDDALADGIVDVFESRGLPIFGPSKRAAQIESSKAFSKQFMQKAGIPTAKFAVFDDYQSAKKFLPEIEGRVVVKASGLALGKGVIICQNQKEVEAALVRLMVDKEFGAAGQRVVVEEYLAGQEVSIHAFCDGRTAKLFPSAQDHKPIFDGDKGPNTGGMGAFAPVPWVEKSLMQQAQKGVVEPVIDGLRQTGHPFVGCLYPGLKITPAGLKVLEFNARFGDPETQVYMRLLKTDLLDILQACVQGELDKIKIEWQQRVAVCVVLASGGYPGAYRKGLPINGLKSVELDREIIVFHAGTALKGSQLTTAGGRVFGVTATGESLEEAIKKAYFAVDHIHFDGMQYRRDIGAKARPASK